MRRLLLFPVLLFHGYCYAQALSPKALGLLPPQVPHCSPVKDQYLSSTCWSFASMAFLESELIRNGKKDIDLSEMFIARHSYLRKIRRHLQLKGLNFFTPGGQFHDVSWVIRNHGIVPESAYPGKMDEVLHYNHSELDTLVAQFVRGQLIRGVTTLSNEDEEYINGVFDKYLGVLPDEFIYRGEVYTPFSFRERVLELNLDDYMEITSYTHHPVYKSYVLEDKYNWTGDAYLNVSIADFSRITNHALEKGFTVGWDGDASDIGFDFRNGLALMMSAISDTVSARQNAFEDKTTLLDHMMQVVGKVQDKNGRSWYYIKNSWGNYSNSLNGFLFMREDYFLVRTVAIIVNKNAIPGDIRSRIGI